MAASISHLENNFSALDEKKGSVYQNNLEARIADYKKRIFYIGIDNKGKVYAKQLVEKEKDFVWVLFKQIHGVPNFIPPERKEKFLSCLSENGVPHLRCGELHMHFRLRGGMLEVASAAKNLSGFFTANSYRKLVQQTGAEARATIQVGGQEVRATIEKAEDSACRTISDCKYAVGSCLEKARSDTSRVLEKTKVEMESVIAATGIESRHTSRHLAIQVEHLMRQAVIDTETILAKAGRETRNTVEFTNREARETALLLSNEADKMIHSSSREIGTLIKNGSIEIKGILEQSTRESKIIIEEAGEEFSIRSSEVINLACEQAQQVITHILEESEVSLSHLLDRIREDVHGIVLSLGDQGRLMIQDTGQEVRVTADHVLAKAFQGQQMVIKGIGYEARLTVEAFGKEVRSTLYEIPFIAGVTAEQVGRGLVHGLRSELLGSSPITTLIYKIERAMHAKQEISVFDLLNFISQQNQASIQARDKVKLYVALINLFNDPVLCAPEEARKNAFLLIGVAAIRDKDLRETTHSWIFFSQQSNLAHEVIKEIPGEEIRESLRIHGDQVLDALEPRVERIISEEIVEREADFDIKFDQALDHLDDLKTNFEKTKSEKTMLASLNKEKDCLIEMQSRQGKEKESKIQELTEKISDLNKAIESLKLEIKFLQSSKFNDYDM
jgi:vacuolar-type H+-ATPase subunit H